MRGPTVGEAALAAAAAAVALLVLAAPQGGDDSAGASPARSGAAAVRVASLPPQAGVSTGTLPPEVAADPFGGRPWPAPVGPSAADAAADEPPVRAAAPVQVTAPAATAAPEVAPPRAIDQEPEHTPG